MTDRDLPTLQATRAELEPHWPRPESLDALVEMLLDGLEHMRPGEAAWRLDAVIAIEQLRAASGAQVGVDYGKLLSFSFVGRIPRVTALERTLNNYGIRLVDGNANIGPLPWGKR